MPKLSVQLEGYTYEVELDSALWGDAEITVRVNGEAHTLRLPDQAQGFEELDWLVIDGRSYEIAFDHDLEWIQIHNHLHKLEISDLEASVARPVSGDKRVKAPIPGLITKIMAGVGDVVELGQPLMILEAMKMENQMRAQASGVVKAIHVTIGQIVVRNEVLIEIS